MKGLFWLGVIFVVLGIASLVAVLIAAGAAMMIAGKKAVSS